MALGLFVAFLYAGTNYLNIDNYVVKSNESTIESTVLMLASQFTAYENLKGYQLPKNNWQAEIFAINRFTPRTLENTVWSYDNTSGYYFCLSGNITQNQYRAFKAVEKNIEGKAFVNTTCGSLTSLSYNGTYPANVAITFWIRN
jgi:hypothetical protein